MKNAAHGVGDDGAYHTTAAAPIPPSSITFCGYYRQRRCHTPGRMALRRAERSSEPLKVRTYARGVGSRSMFFDCTRP